MGPVDPFADKAVHEQGRHTGPGKAARRGIVEVRNVRLQPFAIAIIQRQTPDRIVAGQTALDQRLRRLVPPRHQRGQVRAQGDTRRPGQGREIDQQVGLELAGPAQRIGQDQAPSASVLPISTVRP
jgi:hypothetical protein